VDLIQKGPFLDANRGNYKAWVVKEHATLHLIDGESL